MGVGDKGMPARTLGRNAPIFTTLLIVEPADAQAVVDIPLRISEFTQAFELSITCRGNTEMPGINSAFLFLVNGEGIGQAVQAESIVAEQNYRQIIPGWRDSINIIGMGVDTLDYTTRRQVVVSIVAYQLDRVTRDEYLGSG